MRAGLRANPVLRIGFGAAAVAFCVFGLTADWPQVHAAVSRVQWYSLSGAFLAAAAGYLCMTMAWRTNLSDLGSRLPIAAAVRVMSISQIAKYLPGAIWVFAAQVELGRDYQIDRRRSVAAVIIALAISLGTALLIATATLPIASSGAAHHYWWFMAIAPLIGVCLVPPVLRRLLDGAFALARQPPLERPPSTSGLLIAVGWTTLGWLFWGLHAWLLVADLASRSLSTALLALGGYALAWSAGILLVLFPGGLGPRELAFVIVLAPVMPRGSALLVALMSRLVMTATDAAMAFAGLIIGRATRHSRAPATATRGVLHVGRHRKPKAQRPSPRAMPTSGPKLGNRPDLRVQGVVATPRAALADLDADGG